MLASPRRILFAYGQDAEDITVQSRRPHSILTQLRARGSVVNVSPLNQSAIRLLAPLELLFGAFGLILNTASAHSYSFICRPTAASTRKTVRNGGRGLVSPRMSILEFTRLTFSWVSTRTLTSLVVGQRSALLL